MDETVGKYLNKGIELGKGILGYVGIPCVYVALGEDDEPLYIGKSNNGVERPLRNDHHALRVSKKRWQEVKSILVYEVESIEIATMCEEHLINRLKPKYNERIVNREGYTGNWDKVERIVENKRIMMSHV